MRWYKVSFSLTIDFVFEFDVRFEELVLTVTHRRCLIHNGVANDKFHASAEQRIIT